MMIGGETWGVSVVIPVYTQNIKVSTSKVQLQTKVCEYQN